MAPPMGGGGGPRPMTAGMAPPSRGPAASKAPAQEVNTGELIGNFQRIFDLFMSVEQNQKVRGDVEQKFNVMI